MVYKTCTAANVCLCIGSRSDTHGEWSGRWLSYLAASGVRVCGAARIGAGAAGASIPMHGTVTHIA